MLRDVRPEVKAAEAKITPAPVNNSTITDTEAQKVDAIFKKCTQLIAEAVTLAKPPSPVSEKIFLAAEDLMIDVGVAFQVFKRGNTSSSDINLAETNLTPSTVSNSNESFWSRACLLCVDTIEKIACSRLDIQEDITRRKSHLILEHQKALNNMVSLVRRFTEDQNFNLNSHADEPTPPSMTSEEVGDKLDLLLMHLDSVQEHIEDPEQIKIAEELKQQYLELPALRAQRAEFDFEEALSRKINIKLNEAMFCLLEMLPPEYMQQLGHLTFA